MILRMNTNFKSSNNNHDILVVTFFIIENLFMSGNNYILTRCMVIMFMRRKQRDIR